MRLGFGSWVVTTRDGIALVLQRNRSRGVPELAIEPRHTIAHPCPSVSATIPPSNPSSLTDDMTTVAIIGAGALGLAGARRLAQQGVEVTVYEREPLAGGLAAGVPIGQAWLEKFYHHIFESDRRMIEMIEELGLSDRLVWGRPTTTSLRDGQIRRLDGPLEVLRYTPLSPLARLRLGLGMALLKLISDPERLEGQTAAHWLRTWLGDECYEVVWRPLLTGKFGAASDQIGMPWFWARVHDRTSQLGYLRGGFQQLYDALAADIESRGGRIELGCPISSIERRSGRLFVDTA